jgi:hypothetical protein
VAGFLGHAAYFSKELYFFVGLAGAYGDDVVDISCLGDEYAFVGRRSSSDDEVATLVIIVFSFGYSFILEITETALGAAEHDGEPCDENTSMDGTLGWS